MRTRMLAFFIGIVLFTQLPFLPSIYWSGLLLLWPIEFAARSWLAVYSAHTSRHVNKLITHVLLLLTGSCWILIHAHIYFNQALPAHWQQKTITVSGEIISIPVNHNDKKSFIFNVEHAQFDSEKIALGKIKLNWHHTSQTIKAGQRWELSVRLKQPHSMLNPGGFDYEKWMLQQKIVAAGYIYAKGRNTLLSYDSYSLHAIRTTIYERLSKTLANNKQLGIILALTLGERSTLTTAQWEIFKKTGTSHLVAISGLHIGLVAGFVFLLTKLIWRRSNYLNNWLPAIYVAALFSLAIAIIYSALAGFSVPTIRACVMYGVLMTCFILKRNVASWDILLFALIAVLIIDPFSILSVGFWLSFAAVFVIIYVASGQFNINKLKAYFNIQIAIFIFLMPFLLSEFSQISLVAPAVNLIVIPFMSFILLPATLLGSLILFVNNTFAIFLFAQLSKIYDLFWGIVTWSAGLSISVIDVQPSITLYYLLALVGTLLLLLPARLSQKWIGIILFLPVFMSQKAVIHPGDIIVTFLDVGQGTSIVLATRNHLLVYDAGAKYNERFDMGKNIILPYLKSNGIFHIDKLIISHGDNDHIGGAETILNNVTVGKIESSVPKMIIGPENIRNKVGRCREGDSWIWDDVTFTYLSPADFQYKHEASDSHQQNNASCVLLIETNKFWILLTGDIEIATEYRLVNKYGTKLKANLLLVPHHGSNTSSSREFLAQVEPEYAIISAGHLNRYRLPHKKVIARYARYTKTQIYNTSQSGAVQFHIKRPQQLHKNMVDIKLYRHQRQSFWRHENMPK